MILCCSQRTDLCAFYSDWLCRRFQAGLVDVRNPFAPHQILRLDCSPSQVDAVIFITKNPTPILDKMDVFREYAVGFQVTVTPYGRKLNRDFPTNGSSWTASASWRTGWFLRT